MRSLILMGGARGDRSTKSSTVVLAEGTRSSMKLVPKTPYYYPLVSSSSQRTKDMREHKPGG